MKTKQLTEGPLGFKVTNEQAKAIDALLKTLPKDYHYRKASAVAEEVQLVPGERADISLVSTESLDRQAEVVLAKGVKLDIFRENPIVTFAHKYDELPVGRAKWIKLVQRGLLAKTQYAARPSSWEGSWLPDAVFSMTQEGILKGKSIGFLPTKMRGPTKEELSMNPTWKNAQAVIEESVLLEYAVAPVPVNQDALTIAVSKGFNLDAELAEKLGVKLPKAEAKKAFNWSALAKAIDGITIDERVIEAMILQRLKTRGKV